jgi:hypothetical protein
MLTSPWPSGESALSRLFSRFLARVVPWHPKPDFLGIGVQKGGTTTLYNVLRKHQEVFLTDEKEVHYFTNHFDRRLSWYLAKFRGRKNATVSGEITPYYIFHPAAPWRIHRFNPSMKLILLLRDPVERAVSHYHHAVRWGLETLPLADALDAEDERLADSEETLSEPGSCHYSHQHHSYAARSRYELQIANYLRKFSPEQILVLQSERFFLAGAETLARICAFLGIADFGREVLLPRSNEGESATGNLDRKVAGFLREKLEPTYASMERCYGFHW